MGATKIWFLGNPKTKSVLVYLKWRYEDCPDTEYTFWILRNRPFKTIQGIVITKERFGIGCLVDISTNELELIGEGECFDDDFDKDRILYR